MSIPIAIIENEVAAQQQLKRLSTQLFPEAKITGFAATVPGGLRLIRNTQPKVVFLDVELDDGLGFDILQHCPRPDFLVVFFTAFQHYALQAIQMSAVDYLLKPILTDDFQEMVEKIRHRLQQAGRIEEQAPLLKNLYTPPTQQKLILRDIQHLYVLDPSDIDYCKAEGRYTRFVSAALPKGDVLISQNLQVYEGLLSHHQFFRCHHSYLINLQKVNQVDRMNLQITLRNQAQVPLSHRKRLAFLEALDKMAL